MNRKAVKSIIIAIVCSSSLALNASQIDGGISLSGSVTFLGDDLNGADGFQTFSGVSVSSVSGSYAAAGLAVGTGVTMTAFVFDPFASAGVVPLWQTTSGSAASFDLTSLTSVVQPGDNTLSLRGSGTLYLAGYDPTPGLWIFTAQGLSSTFSFSSSNGSVATVPDNGFTGLFLGTALLGVAVVRRKLA